jgi:hypothetical protein
MTLAEALLEAGETQSVSNFLDQCDKHQLTDSSKKMLLRWREAIIDGRKR